MSLTIETELKDIFIKIDQRLERMEQGQNELKLSVSELNGEVKSLSVELKGEIKNLSTEVKGEIKALDEKLSGQITNLDEKLGGKINTLDTKVDGLSTRISNQEFLLRTIVGGLVLIILSGAIRMFWNFPVN
jgi:chromosome segregation ATPase